MVSVMEDIMTSQLMMEKEMISAGKIQGRFLQVQTLKHTISMLMTCTHILKERRTAAKFINMIL